jgi:mRNA-degrading endonuclease RelE of RelBE toxin-antitoxin system
MSGMNFRISDTFTASLARLTGDEQKAVKTTAFDLQLNPANPGMSFHKLDKARDKNFWSVRVGSDIRLIVHRSADSLLLCYVDHHDRAYQWAERRRLEAHPTTGAAQWVEVRERVDEILVHKAVPTREPAVPPGGKPLLFSHMSDEDLLGWGVPTEWLAEVRLADEDSLLTLADRLPAEAAEALIELATGGTPRRPQTATAGADPFAHPDAQRRFRVMQDVEELERALEFPWDQWTVFLHPAQRQWVERDHGGPARVSGSAGTGKTIVALHRAVHLARNNENARVLLTTFSPALAHALHARLRRLVGRTPMLAERIDVVALDELGERLFKFAFGKPALVDDQTVRRYLGEAAASVSTPAKAGGGAGLPAKFGAGFWWSEWADVIDPWQIDNEEGYRDFRRLGRKTRLSEGQRTAAWQVFGRVRERLRAENRLTRATLFARLAEHYAGAAKLPFEHVVVDEAQDISAPQLRFLSALGGQQRNALFFAGDLGQRIFQLPFSWKSLGVDVRGRSRTLHVNYRTSHQIRMQADRLLGPELADVDGNNEDRKGTVSVFNGPAPVVRAAASIEAEARILHHLGPLHHLGGLVAWPVPRVEIHGSRPSAFILSCTSGSLKTRCISALIFAPPRRAACRPARTPRTRWWPRSRAPSRRRWARRARRRALGGGLRQRADLAFLGHRQRRGHVVEHHLDLPAHQVGDGELAALVGHVLHRRAGQAT